MDTLYVSRTLLNGKEFSKWALDQGFIKHLEPDDFHVTIAFSKKEVDWSKFTADTKHIRIKGGKRVISPLGDEGAVVLKFESNLLQKRWKEFCRGGCSWDYESYQPHVSITYRGADLDLSSLKVYNGPLVFGPEKFAKVNLDWAKDKQ